MNQQQKRIVANFVAVIVLTIAAVIAMIHLKDWVNRSEATKAMNQLSQEICRYRKANGAVPPESYIDSIKKTLQGHARFGGFQYADSAGGIQQFVVSLGCGATPARYEHARSVGA